MIIRTVEELGMLIREARRKAGLSQAQLALKLNSTQGWISEVENGKATAAIGMVFKVLAALDVKLDAVTGDGTPRLLPLREINPIHHGISLARVLDRTRKPRNE